MSKALKKLPALHGAWGFRALLPRSILQSLGCPRKGSSCGGDGGGAEKLKLQMLCSGWQQ